MSEQEQYKRPESVLVVVYDRQKNVLLLHRHKPSHFWQSPAGSLRWGEMARDAAERELYEETGLNAENLSNCLTVNHYIIYPMWRHRYAPGIIENTEHVFGLEVPEQHPIHLDINEHSEYLWLDAEHALQRLTSYTNQAAVRRWVH